MFALGLSYCLAKGMVPDETNIIEGTASKLGLAVSTEFRAELHGVAVAEAAKFKTGSLLYGRAFKAFEEFAESPGTPEGALIAPAVATHFHYPSCDLLDMSDTEFTELLTSGVLNPALRLSRLKGHGELAAKYLLDHSLGPSLLTIACGEGSVSRPALDEESHLFGAWSRKHIWGSSLFEKSIGQKADTFIFGPALEKSRELDHDESSDFRLLETNNPAWVFEHDRSIMVDSPSRRSFWQNLRDGYEVERTNLLVRSFQKAFGPVEQ